MLWRGGLLNAHLKIRRQMLLDFLKAEGHMSTHAGSLYPLKRCHFQREVPGFPCCSTPVGDSGEDGNLKILVSHFFFCLKVRSLIN